MIKFSKSWSIPLLIALTLIFNPVYAQGQGKGQGHGHGKGQSQGKGAGHGQGHVQGQGKIKNKSNMNKQGIGNVNRANAGKVNRARFAKTDSATITKYYKAHPFPVSNLPPGIAKNLARGKPLPPGIEKVFLPSDLAAQLPVRNGYDYLVAGKDVVLINQTTGIVDDILVNALN